jgi:hypothetical protein
VSCSRQGRGGRRWLRLALLMRVSAAPCVHTCGTHVCCMPPARRGGYDKVPWPGTVGVRFRESSAVECFMGGAVRARVESKLRALGRHTLTAFVHLCCL